MSSASGTQKHAACHCNLPLTSQRDDQHPPVWQAQPRLVVAHGDTDRTAGLPGCLQVPAGVQAGVAPVPRGLLQAGAPMACRQSWGTSFTKERALPAMSELLSRQPRCSVPARLWVACALQSPSHNSKGTSARQTERWCPAGAIVGYLKCCKQTKSIEDRDGFSFSCQAWQR